VASLTALRINPGLASQGVMALLDFGGSGTSITLADAGASFEPIDETTRYTDLLSMISVRDASLEASAQALQTSKAETLSMHREIDEAGRSYTATIEHLKAEKSMLEGALSQLRDDRDGLQREVVALKHEAETAWSNERLDSALLRERINDVAAEVARLAANLEGSESPIERIINEAPPPPVVRQNGPGRAAAGAEPANGERPLSLAERIRALQTRSGRS
jgi:outer membrane murein-binding lipoprotein Lpp